MKVTTVKSSECENKELLEDNLRHRFNDVEQTGEDTFKIEIGDKPERASRIPGIEKYTEDNQEHRGFGGKPVDHEENVYLELKNKKDFATALNIIRKGKLPIINTDQTWNLKILRLYCPSIKKVQEPLPGSKTLSDLDINRPDSETAQKIYQNYHP